MRMGIAVRLCLALFLFGFSLMAQASASKNVSKDQSSHQQSARKTLSEKEKNEVRALLEANDALHSAFFTFDPQSIETKAAQVVTAIQELSNAEVKQKMMYSLEKLKGFRAGVKREELNQSYHEVSMALIHLITTYDVGEGFNAYSCPMVKKKWLQNTAKKKKIQNPYAPEMPACGSKDTRF